MKRSAAIIALIVAAAAATPARAQDYPTRAGRLSLSDLLTNTLEAAGDGRRARGAGGLLGQRRRMAVFDGALRAPVSALPTIGIAGGRLAGRRGAAPPRSGPRSADVTSSSPPATAGTPGPSPWESLQPMGGVCISPFQFPGGTARWDDGALPRVALLPRGVLGGIDRAAGHGGGGRRLRDWTGARGRCSPLAGLSPAPLVGVDRPAAPAPRSAGPFAGPRLILRSDAPRLPASESSSS